MSRPPTLSLQVIPAAEIDIPATVALINAAFRVHPILLDDRTSEESIVDELWPGCRFVQVFEDDTLVGTASITPGATAPVEGHEFPGIVVPRSLYFGLAAVRPDRMGDGIGARLLAETERIARSEGFDQVILTTLEEMGNVDYYQRIGYRTVSIQDLPSGHWSLTIPTHYHGMAKDLGRPVIRTARLSEAETISDLVNLAYEVENFFKVGPRTDPAEVASLIERQRFFIAESEGAVVGCVQLSVDGARGHFGMLSVHPEAQGQGVATSLVRHLIEFCAVRGCQHLDLEYVNLREELPAFYRRFGFVETGSQPWPADELHRISRPAHFVTMSRELTPVGGYDEGTIHA